MYDYTRTSDEKPYYKTANLGTKYLVICQFYMFLVKISD